MNSINFLEGMDRQMYTVLYKRKQLFEAQIRASHFSTNVLEDNRLTIRTGLSADSVPRFWNISREFVNSQVRTHMALVAEYCWVLSKLEKFNKIHSGDRRTGPDPTL